MPHFFRSQDRNVIYHDQWEFQDPKMEVYHIKPYFGADIPTTIALKNRSYMVGTSNHLVPEVAIDMLYQQRTYSFRSGRFWGHCRKTRPNQSSVVRWTTNCVLCSHRKLRPADHTCWLSLRSFWTACMVIWPFYHWWKYIKVDIMMHETIRPSIAARPSSCQSRSPCPSFVRNHHRM